MRMTKEKAISVLTKHQDYILHDEELGICTRAPLQDAIVIAIKALREQVVNEKKEPLTNADKLRTMDETAFVRFLDDVTWSALDSRGDFSKLKYPPDTLTWREWLQQPAKED